MCSLATLEEVSGWLQRDAQVWDELTAEDRRTFCTWYGDPEGADNEFEMVAEVGLWSADANDYVTVAGAEEFWGGAGQRLLAVRRFDVDRVGALIGQHHGCHGARNHARQIDDAHTLDGDARLHQYLASS